MTILEQLWYETLHPAKIIKKSNPQYSKPSDIIDENETKLLHLLTDEGEELFHKYVDALADISSMEQRDIFINGLRIGARLMLEIMDEASTAPRND